MSSKCETPKEVTLEKSSSGTWSVPESPRNKLKPWQRLWIVAAIIYLLMLAGSYYMLMPDQESIERTLVLSVTEEVRRYDGMAFAGESPRKIFEAARSQGYGAWITATRSRYSIGQEGDVRFAVIEKNYREALSDLPMKRIVGILICIIVWVVPMAVLYAIGFVVDWIRVGARGIRQE